MNILDCIPIGHKNAIDRDVLNGLMRMGDRQVRKLIKGINDSEDDSLLIINLQDGKGYFRPAPDENNLVKIWRAQERARGNGVLVVSMLRTDTFPEAERNRRKKTFWKKIR